MPKLEIPNPETQEMQEEDSPCGFVVALGTLQCAPLRFFCPPGSKILLRRNGGKGVDILTHLPGDDDAEGQ